MSELYEGELCLVFTEAGGIWDAVFLFGINTRFKEGGRLQTDTGPTKPVQPGALWSERSLYRLSWAFVPGAELESDLATHGHGYVA